MSCSMYIEVVIMQDEKVQKICCTTMCLWLTTLQCTLTIIGTENFIRCILSQFKKNGKDLMVLADHLLNITQLCYATTKKVKATLL